MKLAKMGIVFLLIIGVSNSCSRDSALSYKKYSDPARLFSIDILSNMRIRKDKEFLFSVEAGLGAPNISVKEFIVPIPEKSTVNDIGAILYEQLAKHQKIKKGRLVSATEVKLKDGNNGYLAYIKWEHPGFKINIQSLMLLTRKNDNAYVIIGSDLDLKSRKMDQIEKSLVSFHVN